MAPRILVLGADDANSCVLERAVGRTGKVEYIRERSHFARRLNDDSPPDALIICGDCFREGDVRILITLNKRGILPPTALFINGLRLEKQLLHRWWPIADITRPPLFADANLGHEIQKLLRRQRHLVAKYVCACLRIQDSAIQRMIWLLTDMEFANAPVEVVAAELCMSRSSLYRRLKRQHLPGIQQFQVLFRLLKGAGKRREGASARVAARSAGFASEKSFRRAVRNAVGLSMKEIRIMPGWRWFVDRWGQRNCGCWCISNSD